MTPSPDPRETPERQEDLPAPQDRWWAAVRAKDNVAAWRAGNEMALALAFVAEDAAEAAALEVTESPDRAAHDVVCACPFDGTDPGCHYLCDGCGRPYRAEYAALAPATEGAET